MKKDWFECAMMFLILQVVACMVIGMVWPEEASQQPLLAIAKAAAFAAIATFVHWRVTAVDGRHS